MLNVHNLLHLVEDVKSNGPLWCNSLFMFEDWNGDITDYFHGTQNIPNQVKSFKQDKLYMFLLVLSVVTKKGKESIIREYDILINKKFVPIIIIIIIVLPFFEFNI